MSGWQEVQLRCRSFTRDKERLISVWSRSPVAAAVDSVAAFTLKRSLVSIVLFPDAAKFSVQ